MQDTGAERDTECRTLGLSGTGTLEAHATECKRERTFGQALSLLLQLFELENQAPCEGALATDNMTAKIVRMILLRIGVNLHLLRQDFDLLSIGGMPILGLSGFFDHFVNLPNGSALLASSIWRVACLSSLLRWAICDSISALVAP